MDFTDALKAGGASTVLILAVGVAYKLLQTICNHRIKSECCGKTMTVGVATETMGDTPHEAKKEAFAVSVPEVVARTEEKAKD
ncbi:hypothetical protein EBR66_06615 [bacterium]|nr:hypothetical protein [bacterium]